MASIRVYRRSESRSAGLRFRISDGRGVCLYWSSNTTNLSINQYLKLLSEVYSDMLSRGLPLQSSTLRQQMQKALFPSQDRLPKTPPIVTSYLDYLRQNYESGFMGASRYRQCCAKASRLDRYLRIKGRCDMRVQDFGADELLDYRNFVMNEYLYAARFPQFYPDGCRLHRPMKNNSVVHEMRALRCFFAELEDKGSFAARLSENSRRKNAAALCTRCIPGRSSCVPRSTTPSAPAMSPNP